MNERPFQKRVEDMATRFGWKWWHVPAPMQWAPTKKAYVPARNAAGLADLILTHDDPPRLVFMELKGDGGKLSDAQTEFLQAVQTVAQYCDVPNWKGITSEGAHVVERLTRIGVYAFWPKDEPLIEQLLRSRVLT